MQFGSVISKIARRRHGMLLTKDRMLSELIIANDLKDNIMVSIVG